MRFNKPTRIVAAIAVIGAVAAGGAAFTAGTGQPGSQVLGYGSTSVTGGSITAISYQLSTDGTDINTVTLTTGQDLTNADAAGTGPATVNLAFDNHGFGSGGDAACVVSSSTTVVCTPSSTTTTASVTSVQVAITDGAETFS